MTDITPELGAWRWSWNMRRIRHSKWILNDQLCLEYILFNFMINVAFCSLKFSGVWCGKVICLRIMLSSVIGILGLYIRDDDLLQLHRLLSSELVRYLFRKTRVVFRFLTQKSMDKGRLMMIRRCMGRRSSRNCFNDTENDETLDGKKKKRKSLVTKVKKDLVL